MFLGYQNNKVVLAAHTREELENAPCMAFDRIEESPHEYVLWGGEWVLKEDGEVLRARAEKESAVAELETRYNLPRPLRTALLLAREAGQTVDAVLMARVDEIEALAAPLREAQV